MNNTPKIIIVFDKTFPQTLQPLIESILADKLWILPNWLQSLYVGFDGYDTNNSATMMTDKDYRFARLTICSHFQLETESKQNEMIYHELIHCQISPIVDYFRESIEILVPDNNPLKEILFKELERKHEMTTQDFAYAVHQRLQKEVL